MTSTDALGRAWGWVAHLRAGGTTPWLAWSQRTETEKAGTDPAATAGRVVPGAQQLELLRRINLAAASAGSRTDQDRSHRDLADRVIRAPAAGRGKADLPLVGVGASTYGPTPVDPAEVRPYELARVASVLLAEDLVELGVDPLPVRAPRRLRRRYRLVGDPLVAAAWRDELAARGRPQGGFRPLIVVAAGPLDELLAHTWTQRCFEHGTKPWAQWLRYWHERDQLPARVDLGESARRWGGRGPFVRIVTDHDLLPRQLGVRTLPPVQVPGADQAELARRIAAVVGLKVPAHERPELMRTLRLRMPVSGVAPVTVPDAELAWVHASAARMSRDLSRAGYAVVGDLADLAPRPDRVASVGGPGTSDQQVLDLAVAMLVDNGWRTNERQADQ